jgi:hypothetical protein
MRRGDVVVPRASSPWWAVDCKRASSPSCGLASGGNRSSTSNDPSPAEGRSPLTLHRQIGVEVVAHRSSAKKEIATCT